MTINKIYKFIKWNTTQLKKGICKSDMVAHICNPNYFGGRGRRISNSRSTPTKVASSNTLFEKQNKN
jgi:hypothetical protein